MISVISAKFVGGGNTDEERSKGVMRYGFAGLVSDAFPIGEYGGRIIANGSIYKVINSGDRYIYDSTGKEWHKDESGGGGGEDPEGRPATDEEIDETIDNLDDL